MDSKRAFKYYCLGLNSKEIAKLLNCSYRTVQNYMSTENWKAKRQEIRAKEQEKYKKQFS